jgi:hypothetical protein
MFRSSAPRSYGISKNAEKNKTRKAFTADALLRQVTTSKQGNASNHQIAGEALAQMVRVNEDENCSKEISQTAPKQSSPLPTRMFV